MRVNELDDNIQQYKSEELKFEEKITDNKTRLERMKAEVREVDDRILSLRPGTQLDTMDDRCKPFCSVLIP